MDKSRLRHLAGMKHPEGSGDSYGKREVLQEMSGGRVDTVKNVAYKLHQLAEERAYKDSEAGRQNVAGDAIWKHYEEIRNQLDQHVRSLIEGEYN